MVMVVLSDDDYLLLNAMLDDNQTRSYAGNLKFLPTPNRQTEPGE
jgi:hypothetical protein